MSKRLVYIASSSSDKTIGSYIRQDVTNMKSIFEPYENEGKIIFRTDEFATHQTIVNRFRDNKILPWLFYFSGHSDSNGIRLEDRVLCPSQFVKIFDNDKIRETLQLVYLGSCNSIEIGKQLCENKIKLTIVSNKDVEPHLSNIVSKLFFNRFFFADTIQEAFRLTENDYKSDRERLMVNEDTEFPWRLLQYDHNDPIPMKKIKLSAEQKTQIFMNSAAIRLQFLDYYLKDDKSKDKKTNLIKKEAKGIRINLSKSAAKVDELENVNDIFSTWKGSALLNSMPKKNRFLRTTKPITSLSMSEDFVSQTKARANNMIKLTDEIIEH